MKPARPASNTPMMAQYLAIRDAHPGYLLFYRMGDFYELFFEDAVQAAGALDIALTKRGRHDGEDIPMAGVPVRAHEAYLERLIRKGFKVAICEQTEDPAEARGRGSGAVVARDVVRLITPGTLTEDALLEAQRHNYLAVLAEANGAKAVAWADISTGEFRVESVEGDGLPVLLARIEPSELVLPETLLDETGFDGAATPLPAARFDSENARRRLLEAFEVATLEGFGRFDRAQQTACGVLVDYLELTQKGRLPRLEPPRPAGPGQVLEIDPATRRNLELTATLSGERRGSLLATIDRTRSAGGGRLLAAWLAAPLTDSAAVAARHDAVERLCREERLRRDLVGRLARTPDIERSLSRLGLGRRRPREPAGLRAALTLRRRGTARWGVPP
ncbi:MAG: DNA mismatch repair protein MutS, partial [Alphaproteobacteria bacterium]|nr:DNA mismatch repair protein MutS [Alphaproteobacteria bacterium]